jgi:hypothetical protein
MEINQNLYERLQTAARQGEPVTYAAVAALLHLNLEDPAQRNLLAEQLGAISTFEHQQGRPMLSVMVGHSGDLSPGSGFFNLARSLGRLSDTDEAGETRFYVREFERVLAYWQGTEPS